MDNTYITPVYSQNAVVISAASSNEYVPYLSVWLESIKKFASPNNNYDIVILEDSIEEENKKKLKDFFETSENLSLRFFNPSVFFIGLNMHVTFNYVSKVSFYRVGCPIYFSKYSRLITTDLDLIFNEDPAELFNMDMKGNLILSVLEPIWSRWINCSVKKDGRLVSEYGKNILKLDDLHRYFNTGVALLDITKINQQKLAETCLERMKTDTTYIFLDQDVLNEVYKDFFGVLPYKWNYAVIDKIYVETAAPFFTEYCAVDHPCLIHFLSEIKPWANLEGRLVYKWWGLARETPFYESLLKNVLMLSQSSQEKKFLTKFYTDMVCLFDYSKNKWKRRFYSFISHLAFGSLKEKIMKKKQMAKEKILRVKELKKDFKK